MTLILVAHLSMFQFMYIFLRISEMSIQQFIEDMWQLRTVKSSLCEITILHCMVASCMHMAE